VSRQRIWIMNVALCGLLIWGGFKLRDEWRVFGQSHEASRLQVGVQRGATKTPVQEVPVEGTEAAWTDIASRSPFSFDRSDSNLDLTEAVAAPASGPKPVLLGTLILGNERLALLGKPGTNGRSGARVKVGEKFEGWQVVDIQDSAVVVSADGARESLSVGRAPVVRSSEKTSDASPSSVVNSTPPAAAAAPPRTPDTSAGATRILGTGSMSTPPTVVPPGSHLVETPFGYKIEQDSK